MTRKRKSTEPSLRVAPVVLPKTEPVTEVAAEPSFWLLTVDGLWMTCFHPLQLSEDYTKAVKLTEANAMATARHLEFRKKGECEVIPV